MKQVVIAGFAAAVFSTASIADTYKLDADHTNARFAIGHFGTSTNHGGFYNLEGELQLDARKQTGSLKVVIPVNTINTGNPNFNNHLLSADLFHAERYPQMVFTSTDWKFVDGKPQQVSGNLELLGKTNPVTLTASQFNCYDSPMFNGAQVCGGDFSATIDRTQWGMDYLVDMGFPTEVQLSIQVEAIKQ